jgi:dolichyldiphosphatase
MLVARPRSLCRAPTTCPARPPARPPSLSARGTPLPNQPMNGARVIKRAKPHDDARPLVIARASSSIEEDGGSSGGNGDRSRRTCADATPTTPTTPTPLALINRATKYAVSLAVLLSVLLSGASPRACWAVAGAVASSGACKLLKRLLNLPRPEGAPKADPGMPSSHANSLAFLASTAALEIARGARVGGGGAEGAAAVAAAPLAAAAAVLVLGAFLSWLRVRLGFHTPAQVGVGCIFGAGCGVAWHELSGPALAWMAEAAGSAEAAGLGLKVAAASAGVAFAVGNARGWVPAGWMIGGGGSSGEEEVEEEEGGEREAAAASGRRR